MNIAETTSLFGSGSGLWLNIYGAITVTITSSLTTTISQSTQIGNGGNGATSTVIVNAAWTDSGLVDVGVNGAAGGAGILDINAGGSLTASAIFIGTAYNTSSPQYAGQMTVSGGGTFTSTSTTSWDAVGDDLGASGTLTVTGAGSSFTSDNNVAIGDAGTGVLYVENGAKLKAGTLYVGVNYGFQTIAAGSGTVTIESGGVVTTTGQYQEIGNAATGSAGDVVEGPTGSVTVTGAGSQWNANNGQIGIGDAGSKSGSLTISNDGAVSATNGFFVGDQYNGADGSYGTLTIESGGTASTGGYSQVGANNLGQPTSTATVTGSGSSWKVNGTLDVAGSGELFVTQGGSVDAESQLGLDDNALIQVDGGSSIEVGGDTGAAALGYLTVDPDSGYYSNLYGDGTIEANVIDNGKIYSEPGTLLFEGNTGVPNSGTVTGDGYLFVGAESTVDLSVASVASSVNVQFSGWDATLKVFSSGFAAPISNFNLTDTIDITGFDYSGGSSSYTFTPSGPDGAGTLTIHEGPGTVTLDIASSLSPISGHLTLSSDGDGGTDVSYTSAATAAPFNLWGSVGSFFTTPSGNVDGEDYGLSAVTDGGTPIWMETETSAASYVSGSGSPANYAIVLATQDWLGSVQPEITIATDNNFVDPFVNNQLSAGNLGAAGIFSNTSTTGYGGIVYWTASATTGDYAVDFEPFTVSYPNSTPSSNLVTITGAPVTMISAIADPLNWKFGIDTSTSLVLAYTTADGGSEENLYEEAFNNNGASTSGAPKLIASGLPLGTPYYVGYSSSDGYGFRYLEVGSPYGTGLVGGDFNINTGALTNQQLYLSLPSYTQFTGVFSTTLNDGASMRIVEGVENGHAVLQSFVNDSGVAEATFDLSSADDHFAATKIYDIATAELDYTALAYTDNNEVHLELLDANGQQIGSDFVVPGISSFLNLNLMQGSNDPSSTRIELDYAAADPNGGQQIEGLIYDISATPNINTLNGGGGLWDGTPYDDTFTWGPGVFTIGGGGGSDTFVATNLSTSNSNLEITVNASGAVIVNDGAGDVDTLIGFTTIELGDGTVTISGDTLTLVKTDGTKSVETFDIAGEPYVETRANYSATGALVSTQEYDANGNLIATIYPSQAPNDFTGDGRSDILFTALSGGFAPGTLITWQTNGASITGAGVIGYPGQSWTYLGSADFYGNGHSDMLFESGDDQLAVWEISGTSIVGGGLLSSPGGTWSVVGLGDFYGSGHSDILFEDASGDLAIWEMNGTSIVGGGGVTAPPSTYAYLGLGDFNGDGKSDLLFRDTSSGNYVIWNMNGDTVESQATLSSPGDDWVYKGVGDFYGQGDSSVLFQDDVTGEYATWNVSNDAVVGANFLGSPGPQWTLDAIGVYTTSGQSDLLLKNVTTGALATWDVDDGALVGGGVFGAPGDDFAVAVTTPPAARAPAATLVFDNNGDYAEWTLSEGAITEAGFLGQPGSDWTEEAVGDFYGNGQADVLFKSASTGEYAIWRTNGSTVVGGGFVGVATGYTFEGLGDFNGDGTSDMLFYNAATGDYATWNMNGSNIIGGADWGTEPGLTFVATGDFTGDGTSDVLFADKSGNYYVGIVNNGAIQTPVEIGAAAGYTFAGIGDLNGNGRDSIVFDQNGNYVSWEMNGAAIVGGSDIGYADPSTWTLEGIGALSPGNHASLVFENSATGQILGWQINDGTIAAGQAIGYAPGFTLVAVR